ncbi:MAG: TVP38/TMEM64 family protein [Xanthobacteraceae bacterium]|nr:TVP38/TMEM64 family protein [Xanthobacteraceae bacterium]QYK45316.1 MAG: TVP38/TMEM64 family protein [Xanthobacteraceae bacterium]
MLPPKETAPAGVRFASLRYLPLLVMVAGAAAFFASGLHREFSIESAFAHRETLLKSIGENPVGAFVLYVAAYSAAIVFAMPGAIVFTMFGGFLFGWIGGALGGILGACIGGAITVLVGGASLGRTLEQASLPRFHRFANGFRNNAFGYIFLLRLIPMVPYIAINVASALFRVPLRTFLAATALGIAPIAICFGFIGSGFDRGVEKQAEAYRMCQAAGSADCSFEIEWMNFLSREMIAGLVILTVLATLPLLFRRRIMRLSRPSGESAKP